MYLAFGFQSGPEAVVTRLVTCQPLDSVYLMFGSSWVFLGFEEDLMEKYIARLRGEERKICDETISKLQGSGRKRDALGSGAKSMRAGQTGTTAKSRTRSTEALARENLRRRCVPEGSKSALDGWRRASPPVPKQLLTGRRPC